MGTRDVKKLFYRVEIDIYHWFYSTESTLVFVGMMGNILFGVWGFFSTSIFLRAKCDHGNIECGNLTPTETDLALVYTK